MSFAGGVAQSAYMTRVRGLSPARCLVVPIDVGKRKAMALVADHEGRVVQEPFEFPLSAPGVGVLSSAATRAGDRVAAQSVRFGIEAAGHYHRPLSAALHGRGFDVVELNPRAVQLARTQLGQGRVKNDVRDCLAMVELLVRGQGWPFHRSCDQIASQGLWAAQRRRKIEALRALANQVHALGDLAFPGLIASFKTGLASPTLRMLLVTITSPAQLDGLDEDTLVAHAAAYGRRILRPKARAVLETARDGLRLPETQQQVAQRLLAREIAALEALHGEIAACEVALGDLLASTPAGVLTSLPGVAVVSASYYGAALGDPHRFANADAAYRYSGLVPTSHESAGRKSGRVRVSREGSVELRQAIITLGTGMSMHHPDFIAYRRRLIASGKKPLIAMVAVAHRAHRLAFAMVRSQEPFDTERWKRSVAKSRSVTATKEVTATT